MKVSRKQFVEEFMAMFGHPSLSVKHEDSDSLVCEVVWPSDLDEPEEIRWTCAEAEAPSHACFQLVSFLAEHDLLDIDKIPMPTKDLYELFVENTGHEMAFSAFEAALQELLAIQIPTYQKGEEFDVFFVHG